tara:strand:+ start:211 stop:792 length:582 start_codon:yes stop_codon:yes gene_type:complete
VDRWLDERTDQDWILVEVRDAEQRPLIVEALQRCVETGRRGRPSDAEEVLVVIRYRDREAKIVKTDYYLSNAGVTTPLAEYCRAAKAEHRVEECLQRAKGQAGLADYEVRNWTGWQHHQTLCLLANWFLTVETRRAEKKTPAMTLNQMRLGIASILRRELGCDLPRNVRWRTTELPKDSYRKSYFSHKASNTK